MTRDLQRFASLGLKVAITEADVSHVRQQRDRPGANGSPGDVRAAVRVLANAQVLPHGAAVHFVHCLGLRDADSWVPGFFTGEGYATLYDVNLQPKPAYDDLQQDLELAADGAPHRTGTGAQF